MKSERHWRGEQWGDAHQNVSDREAGANVEATHSALVNGWYWLACVIPFALAIFAPYAVGTVRQYPSPARGSDWGPILDHPAMIVTGWGFFAAGLVGACIGGIVFASSRRIGENSARRWNATAWSLALFVGLFGVVATAFTNSDYAPPRDANVSSAAIPLGEAVTSSAGGSFKVEVVSIQCDWFSCTVLARVTNTGKTLAEFPCQELSATDSTGQTIAAAWVGLGNNGIGCDLPTVAPGKTAEIPITLPDFHDRDLVRLDVPGSDTAIKLPSINR